MIIMTSCSLNISVNIDHNDFISGKITEGNVKFS